MRVEQFERDNSGLYWTTIYLFFIIYMIIIIGGVSLNGVINYQHLFFGNRNNTN